MATTEDRENAVLALRGKVRLEIEKTVLSVIQSVAEGKMPVLEHLRILTGSEVFKAVVSRTNQDLSLGESSMGQEIVRRNEAKTVIRLGFGPSQRNFALLMHLMSKVYSMLHHGQTCTKRELYYEDVTFYGTQHRLDNGLDVLCRILKVPRDALCVEATSKGLIAGDLSFTNATGDRIDVGSFRSGLLIPGCIAGLANFTSSAPLILVIEKDTVFQRLLGERILDKLGPIILVTGKGYPDFATQKLVKKLSITLNLKVFVLVDCDPHGIEIAAIYRWGSYGQANLARSTGDDVFAEMNVADLIWLGLKPSDVLSLSLPSNSHAVMSPRDKRKIEFVEKRLLVQNDPTWIEEIQFLKGMTKKTELEALFSCPRFFIDVFLKRKLQSYMQTFQ